MSLKQILLTQIKDPVKKAKVEALLKATKLDDNDPMFELLILETNILCDLMQKTEEIGAYAGRFQLMINEQNQRQSEALDIIANFIEGNYKSAPEAEVSELVQAVRSLTRQTNFIKADGRQKGISWQGIDREKIALQISVFILVGMLGLTYIPKITQWVNEVWQPVEEVK